MATHRQLALALSLALAPLSLHAQTDVKPEPKPAPPSGVSYIPPYFPAFIHTRAEESDYRMSHAEFHTFYLKNVTQPNDGNEILTGLRLMLDPGVKMYLLPSQNALAMQILPGEVPIVEKFLAEWDRPHRPYRLIYTVIESDAGKRIGSQSFALDVVNGQRAVLKTGSKVPVVTGSYNSGAASGPSTPSGTQTQFTYLDVGFNIDATLTDTVSGAQVKSKFEQSSVTGSSTIDSVNEPIIRQTSLEGTFTLTPNKPVNLGAIDTPGTTRHLDIEVTLQPL